MADDDECDYMSDVFVTQSSDARPGLLWGKHVRSHEQNKRKVKADVRSRRKPVKIVEQENRDKGLETEISSDNKGFAMLQKMGYKPGEGLGKDKKGRIEPVPIAIKANKTGLGKDAHESRKREAQEKFRAFLHSKKRKYNERLQVDFRARMSGRFNEQQYERDLYKSQKVCHQLHCESGIEAPDFDFFWPARALQAEEECEEETTEDEFSVEEKLFILTKHLRENYFYCLWCAVRYEGTFLGSTLHLIAVVILQIIFADPRDLTKSCPGDTAKDHDD